MPLEPASALHRTCALERLSEAVGALATGSGRVQERLGAAALHLALIGRNELPSDELRAMLVSLIDALTAAQLLDPLENLGDEDAIDLARRVLELYRRLERALRAPEANEGAPPRDHARVMIRCPATGRAVATGLTADPGAWITAGLNRVICPECKRVHFWSRSEGYLEGGIGL